MNRLSLLAAASTLALTTGAFAQETTLDSVVVESTRLPTTVAESGTSVSVVTAEEIERRGYRRVEQILDSLPGVKVSQNGGPGASTSLFIRGVTADKVVVLVDGVPLNDPTNVGGGFEFSSFDTSAIERVEVLRGAQSTLWGADAIGGVVSIKTKRAEEPGFSSQIFGEYGTENSVRVGAAVAGAGEAGDIRLSVTRSQASGFPRRDAPIGTGDDDGFEETAFNLTGRGYISDVLTVFGNARHVDAEADFDENFGAAANEQSLRDETSGSIGFDLLSFGGMVDTTVQAGVSRIDRVSTSASFGDFASNGEREFARIQSNIAPLDRVRLSVGADYESISATGNSFANEVGNDAFGLFGTVEVEPVDNLLLTGGVRHDENSDFDGETTYKASFNYMPVEMLTLRGNIGTGFKAPSLFQLTYSQAAFAAFPPFFAGSPALFANPDLKPETSFGGEIGVDVRLMEGRAQLGATYFNQKIDDQITFNGASGTGPAQPSYLNIGEAEYSGVELTGAFAVTDALTLAGNYTYLDAKNGVTGARLVVRPQHSGEASLSFASGPYSATGTVIYNGEEEAFGGGTVDDWVRVDLSAGYAVTEDIEFYGRVENLFDTEYEEAAGFNTPGLSGFVGVRARF